MSEQNFEAMNKEAPQNALRTARRLFGQLKDQRMRLTIVGICILFYTVLNVYAPYYSAGVVDNLLAKIKDCIDTKETFSIPWNPLGREMVLLAAMYILTSVFYHLQAYLMASVAEKLILRLRKQIVRI